MEARLEVLERCDAEREAQVLALERRDAEQIEWPSSALGGGGAAVVGGVPRTGGRG